MLKYTPGSNSDGSNSRTQSTVRRAIFHVKTLWWLEPNISLHESVSTLLFSQALRDNDDFGYLALKQLAAIYQIKDLSKFSLITT